jgi:hypothetical protein
MRKRILAVLIGVASIAVFAPAHADHMRQPCVPGDESAGYQICVIDWGLGSARFVDVFAHSPDYSTFAGVGVNCLNRSDGATYWVSAGIATQGQLVGRNVNLVRGAPVACPIDP